jgi:hypothetical protein
LSQVQPPQERSPGPRVRSPVLLVSFFSPEALSRIVKCVAAHRRPTGTEVFLGTYGINAQTAIAITAVRRARYAPIFNLDPQRTVRVRARRPLSRGLAKSLDQTYEGPIPSDTKDPRLAGSDHRNWGIELGRRFRDQLRAARASGVAASAWQFDEILGECRYRSEPSRYRRFIGGVLRGLAEGRAELGDKPEQGFVWVAWTAIQALPGLRITPELQLFWEDINASARFIVGEEYPPFRSDPAKSAVASAQPQRSLATCGGEIRTALASRYIVGMTPGWKIGGGLGGNIYKWPLGKVTDWRNRFIGARAEAHTPAGYAQFYLAEDNALPDHIDNAIDALHFAAQHLVGGPSASGLPRQVD